MRIIFTGPWLSIQESVTDEQLSDLVVVSGLNGSGKSQLLDAIRAGALAIDLGPLPRQPRISSFKLGEFLASEEQAQAQPMNSLRDPGAQVYQLAINARSQIGLNTAPSDPGANNYVRDQLRANNVNDHTIERLTFDGKNILELSAEEFSQRTPMIAFAQDPFKYSISQVFGSYWSRQYDNSIRRHRTEVEGFSDSFLTVDEFREQYGRPPWEVLNEILSGLRLSYTFEAPSGFAIETPYEPRLLNELGQLIPIGRLSTGERTLLAIALTLYTGASKGKEFLMPDVLLLDEADASLHPSMIDNLLRVLRTTFVDEHGVKVLLATHSPTTVALAPDSCLYSMRRWDHPRLAKVEKDEALSGLTVGVPTLSTKVENRRLVFVESPTDAKCYELYEECVAGYLLESPFTLVFTPSSTTDKSGSSPVVIDLVQKLRDNGNNLVYGIVDRDHRQGAPRGIKYMSERYTIENLVLDPLVVGALMIHERLVDSPTSLGAASYLKAGLLDSVTAQRVVDAVVRRLEIDRTNMTTISYLGGMQVEVPRAVLDMPGHDLEELYTNKIKELRTLGNGLKLKTLDRVGREVPGLLPVKGKDLIDSLRLVGDPSLTQEV